MRRSETNRQWGYGSLLSARTGARMSGAESPTFYWFWRPFYNHANHRLYDVPAFDWIDPDEPLPKGAKRCA